MKPRLVGAVVMVLACLLATIVGCSTSSKRMTTSARNSDALATGSARRVRLRRGRPSERRESPLWSLLDRKDIRRVATLLDGRNGVGLEPQVVTAGGEIAGGMYDSAHPVEDATSGLRYPGLVGIGLIDKSGSHVETLWVPPTSALQLNDVQANARFVAWETVEGTELATTRWEIDVYDRRSGTTIELASSPSNLVGVPHQAAEFAVGDTVVAVAEPESPDGGRTYRYDLSLRSFDTGRTRHVDGQLLDPHFVGDTLFARVLREDSQATPDGSRAVVVEQFDERGVGTPLPGSEGMRWFAVRPGALFGIRQSGPVGSTMFCRFPCVQSAPIASEPNPDWPVPNDYGFVWHTDTGAFQVDRSGSRVVKLSEFQVRSAGRFVLFLESAPQTSTSTVRLGVDDVWYLSDLSSMGEK